MGRNLRHFLTRGEVTELELRTLHGVVTERAIGRRQRGRLERDMVEALAAAPNPAGSEERSATEG
jgi:hypothetical protein